MSEGDGTPMFLLVGSRRSLARGVLNVGAWGVVMALGVLTLEANGFGLWSSEAAPVAEAPLDSAVGTVAYSPDGETIAAVDFRGRLRLWDPEFRRGQTLTQERIWESPSVAFSPDGRYLAVTMGTPKVRVWDLTRNEPLVELSTARCISLCYSPDGSRLATVSRSLGNLTIWDWARGKPLGVLSTPDGGLLRVSYSSDGRWIAAGDQRGAVYVWDAETLALRRTLKGHQYSILALGFSPDGRMLASAAQEGNIVVWGVETGQIVRELRSSALALSLAFTHQSPRLILGLSNGRIHAIDLSRPEGPKTLLTRSRIAMTLAISPDDQRIVTGGPDETMQVWSITPADTAPTEG